MTDVNSPAVSEQAASESAVSEQAVPEQVAAEQVAAEQVAAEQTAAERLSRAVDRLVGQVAHWQPNRWSMPGGGSTGAAGARPDPSAQPSNSSAQPSNSSVQPSRADRVHALVQRLADLGAALERRQPTPVPRLGDLVLPDQLRVVANDLSATDDGRANGDLAGLGDPAGTDEPFGTAAQVVGAAADDVDAVRRTL